MASTPLAATFADFLAHVDAAAANWFTHLAHGDHGPKHAEPIISIAAATASPGSGTAAPAPSELPLPEVLPNRARHAV